MQLQNNSGFFPGIPLLMIFNLLVYLGIIVMVVVGFIFLVKFLSAGTKAFNLYVRNNSQLNEKSSSEVKNN